MRRVFCLLMAGLLVLLCGCTTSTAETSAEEAAQEDKAAFAAAINELNWKLYDAVDTEENRFYSAYSIESALAMTDVAASGTTKEQMEEVLGISDLDSFMRAANWYRNLYLDPKDEATGKLTTANAVWLEESLSFSKTYPEDVEDPLKVYFGAEINTADFINDADGAKKDISKWVKKNTNGMISDYAPLCDSTTKADLINAIYFYAEWMYKFDPLGTAKRSFFGTKGETQVESMDQAELNLRYVEQDGVRALAFPYENGTFEMDLIMTREDGEDLTKTFKAVDREKLFSGLDEADTRFVSTLLLPKFTMDVTFDGLTDALQDLGMTVPFSEEADFSRLAENLYISDVGHRAKLEVDEEGSKAAAVTEVVMNETAVLEPDDAINFIVNRPFILVIRDVENNVILFTGQVNNLE